MPVQVRDWGGQRIGAALFEDDVATKLDTESVRLRRSNRELHEALMECRQKLMKTERLLELVTRMAGAAND